ncbi:penicillin-binding protein 2 [Cupriavidus metallidurans]|jgi:penicillin-binding protein 2|uniref:Peptidoglycan D,D-transpeptidase MrdA n=1 Tax=Cupriavidus metallidurans (strain ATCC 43123 / DSM 2839 / NBRC 102507 / CH34) TaxID=266264 RepID=Q1LSD6_CUPMC|nr:penicillin-binding protein 2 [Cupriavidus metallidurans]ABF06940.1 transpeptidase involved in peptidoglycan synthesis (penicillin-binding protein 2) [Cupriavidus metallidurans CH34]AVA32166.1 penicillin-binding protein 2 [Cupriavidus metallidurans]KWW33918.1 Penicillin-binding protein 2 [Cupriavidus metallidurans]MDE4916363.1 penicillin-binding protein 2 [Cupriavidus metallidurans]QGS28702.1 penicillin-binding protein 2 [Cupriavidus metallidurans]
MTEIRNVELEIGRFRIRVAAAALFTVVCFGLLFSRFLWLQWYKHDQYSAKAEDNRISVAPIEPNRGIIMDRNGVVLARNYSAYTLEITPSKLTDTLDNTIEELATLVDIQPRDRRRFKRLLEESRSFESLPIRSQLTDEEVARFSAQRFRFPGVDVRARLFRQYPLGEAASHVVGYLGRISQRDQERIEAMDEANDAADGDKYDPRKDADNYKGSNYIGKIGLEQSYETELHGLTGFEEVEVSAGGRPIRTLSTSPATPGNNLILSLDIRLQQLAEQLFGDRRGALVAIEPETGDILAFVSKPTFDPNLFVEGIDSKTWDELNNSPDKPLLNRPLRGTYPPGSTYKPFMALAALTTGKRTAAWGMHDPGFFTLGNHTFRDDKPGGHGWVDMQASIVQSCDTYYYMLARDMGVNAIHDFMKPLGFGQITGIDIEGENRGILPSTDWKRKAYRRPEQQKWYDGETISLGIGQGYNSFTILQLANAVSILVNNGVAMKPHLVKAVEDSVSRKRTLTVPKESYRIPLKQGDIDVIKRSMVAVTHSGTAARVFAGAAYESAGKTGTAQTYTLGKNEKYNHHALDERKRDHSLYTAFAPADHPKIALALIVENAGFGAAVAAPIARKVMDYYLLGKWPEELAATAPPPAERERAGGKPPVDTPSVFTTGQTANAASATVMQTAPAAASDATTGAANAAGASAAGASASVPAARSASDTIAGQLDPDAIAPASAEVTLDARMLQALGHSKPAPTPPATPSRATPASAPAPAKPKTQPARPKPANVAGPASGSSARNNVSE